MSERPGFILYTRHRTLFEHLNMKERGELITAVFSFFCDGEIAVFKNKALAMAYDIITEQISFDSSEYEKKCRKNAENIKKRWADKKNASDTVVSEGTLTNTDTNHTESDSDNKSDTASVSGAGADSEPTARGRYCNVFLSDRELDELSKEFPRDLDERIDRLSEYMKDTGQTYVSHASTIRRWAKNERKKTRVGSSDPYFNEDEYFEAALMRSKRHIEAVRKADEAAANSNQGK